MENTKSINNLAISLIIIGIILLPLSAIYGALSSSEIYYNGPSSFRSLVLVLPLISPIMVLISGICLKKNHRASLISLYISVVTALISYFISFQGQGNNSLELLLSFAIEVGVFIVLLITTIFLEKK